MRCTFPTKEVCIKPGTVQSAEFLDEGARVYLPIDELTHAVPSTRPSTP